ncbi:MAG: glycine zipper domain-containing protein [Desulfobacca sp.]|nr:glycine zipper domain-containing protein [Desulfobacca sp.]
MVRKSLTIMVASLMLISLAGCSVNGHYDPARSAGAGTLGGAALGAALGSIIGAGTGSAATGAWVGAASGALVGGVGSYLYAKHKESQVRDANLAAQQYSYSPSRGNIITIEKVDTNPTKVKPGGQVDMIMSYTLLTPENQPIPVTVAREVQFGGSRFSPPSQNQTTKANGTYVDQVAYQVPKAAQPGTYTVVNKIITDQGFDEKTTYFVVER